MSGKFLDANDLSAARNEQEVWNSMLNRGLIDPSKFVRTQYIVCGCGAPGCGFITRWMKDHGSVVDLEQQKALYQKWLEEHKPVTKD